MENGTTVLPMSTMTTPIPIEPQTQRRELAVGWAMSMIEEIEKNGAKAVAYVLVTDEDSIVTDYELLESEPTSMYGLVTGVTLLHRGLTG